MAKAHVTGTALTHVNGTALTHVNGTALTHVTGTALTHVKITALTHVNLLHVISQQPLDPRLTGEEGKGVFFAYPLSCFRDISQSDIQIIAE